MCQFAVIIESLLIRVGLVSTLTFFVACGEGVHDDPDKLRSWSTQPGSGLVQHVRTGNVELGMMYQPAAYIAQREVHRGQNDYDSLYEQYASSMTFVLDIGISDKDEDVLMKGVQTAAEYEQRMLLMNFRLTEYFHLQIGDSTLKPVLATFENAYGLSPTRTCIVVFEGSPADLPASTRHVAVIFDDPLFGTGLSRFTYSIDDILNVSELRT